eukprot:TRINITY_DN3136_c2_g1_i1.p3 TRINITY_DN3136_c2_g1~~TRINITY_DN3136_c2_g1_i1.p3  ORF type:complete len:104 (+),score=4.78 TRINITY_DN3136_c2_g1_i1:408-719(+)
MPKPERPSTPRMPTVVPANSAHMIRKRDITSLLFCRANGLMLDKAWSSSPMAFAIGFAMIPLHFSRYFVQTWSPFAELRIRVHAGAGSRHCSKSFSHNNKSSL